MNEIKPGGQRKKAIIVKYNCLGCPHFRWYGKEDKTVCFAVNKEIRESYIPDWCPLPDLMTVVKVETTCLDGD